MEAFTLLPPMPTSLVPPATASPAAARAADAPRRTATGVPTPAPSPTPAPPAARATPTTASTAAPPAGAPDPTAAPIASYLALSAVGAGVDGQGAPLTVTTEFSPGATAIYLFFDHRGIPAGALIRHNWFLEGGSVHYDAFAWSGPGDGLAHVDWEPLEPLAPGMYEVRVFLDRRLQFVANFLVK